MQTKAAGLGFEHRYLQNDEIRGVVRQALATLPLDGKRLLVIIPDSTRTMPMPKMFDMIEAESGPRLAALDYLVALGTHRPMTDEQLGQLVGRPVVKGRIGRTRIFNHMWSDPGIFRRIGTIPAAEILGLSNGLLEQDVPVSLNRLLFDYDQILLCGPVFPHEVVGFSGGTKYLFPGIAGPEIIHFTHWLGALICNYHVIGAGYTPIRAVIDRAAAMIDKPMACLALVVMHEGLSGIYFGTPQDAWTAASALSARKHIIHVERPFKRVLSVMPKLYDDLWTAGKGMYKLEPAIADGGEVIIYAPHIDEVSYTHGKILDEIGYHCRDYFIGQWDRFRNYPGGVLAHSTQVKGLGRFDVATGIETPRVQVTLAVGIPEERCRRINLGYVDPATINIDEWSGREHEGILLVPRAGEMLYRLKNLSPGSGKTLLSGSLATDR
jgi:nickel-dependent lactate racemase